MLQPLFVCCVKTAQFIKTVICTQRDGNNQVQVYFLIIPLLKCAPFISGSLVYSLRFRVVGITSFLILKLPIILCVVKTH